MEMDSWLERWKSISIPLHAGCTERGYFSFFVLLGWLYSVLIDFLTSISYFPDLGFVWLEKEGAKPTIAIPGHDLAGLG